MAAKTPLALKLAPAVWIINPGQRRGDDHLAGQLALVGPQDARVGQQVAIDLAYPLKGVEKDDEKDQDGRQRHLGLDVQPQPDGQQGRQRDAWQRIGRFDVGAQHIGQELHPSQQHAKEDPQDDADEEAQHGLFQRDGDLLPQGTLRRALGRPGDELRPDAGGLPPEELVDDAHPRRQFPAANDEDQQPDAQAVDHDAPPPAGHDGRWPP